MTLSLDTDLLVEDADRQICNVVTDDSERY